MIGVVPLKVQDRMFSDPIIVSVLAKRAAVTRPVDDLVAASEDPPAIVTLQHMRTYINEVAFSNVIWSAGIRYKYIRVFDICNERSQRMCSYGSDIMLAEFNSGRVAISPLPSPPVMMPVSRYCKHMGIELSRLQSLMVSRSVLAKADRGSLVALALIDSGTDMPLMVNGLTLDMRNFTSAVPDIILRRVYDDRYIEFIINNGMTLLSCWWNISRVFGARSWGLRAPRSCIYSYLPDGDTSKCDDMLVVDCANNRVIHDASSVSDNAGYPVFAHVCDAEHRLFHNDIIIVDTDALPNTGTT